MQHIVQVRHELPGVSVQDLRPLEMRESFGLVAWAVGLASPVSLAGPVALIIYINRFQIEPEERVLLSRFGFDYKTYRSSVRRWL